MNFIERFKEKFPKLLKIILIVIGVFILLVAVLSVLNNTFKGTFGVNNNSLSSVSVPSLEPSFSPDFSYMPDLAPSTQKRSVSIKESDVGGAVSYSNDQAPVPGKTAEAFEVTRYNVRFEEENSRSVCNSVSGLKARTDVIFEQSNNYDYGCSYQFKVEKSVENEIYGLINGLNPKQLSKSTNTIKRAVDKLTSESDILKRKQENIDLMLRDALTAYNEIAHMAVSANQVDALAKVINSKLATVERLTKESINITNALEVMERNKSEQLDSMNYSYFSVKVDESRFFDRTVVRDSWKQEFRNFVRQANGVVQSLTINLVLFALVALQYIVYILLLVVIIKYVYQIGKRIWNFNLGNLTKK